ncbi:MAG TPA: hypothetical protein VHL34_08010 [Rhizomicrobium sp.]|nr:hypothetical protein [Rhizomicrobium sp.]
MHRFALVLFFALSGPVVAFADEPPPQPSMSRADWASDLDTLYTQMQAIHPALHHHTSAAAMDAYVASFRKTIPTADWPHYVMGLYRLLALVGDGHTTFFPQPDAGPGFDTRYPILPRAFADGVYVVAADKAYAGAVGGKIVAIVGHTTADVFQTLTAYWDHENEGWVLNWLPFMLRRPGYLHGADIVSGDIAAPLVVTIEKNGVRHDVSIKPVPAADDAKGMESAWLHARDESRIAHPTTLHGKDTPFDFVALDDGKVVYAVYNQCEDSDKETVAAFADRLFKFIDTHSVDKLIIDIRENGGGDNYKNQPLLLGMIKARGIDRPGHLFVLTSRRTFSAAQNFANQAERWTQALFVGEPTGSSPNLYGDAKQFELPKTHLHPMVSTLYWEDSDPKDTRVWLLPDIAASQTYADYVAGRDAALEAALAYKPDPAVVTLPPNAHWFRKSQKAGWILAF